MKALLTDWHNSTSCVWCEKEKECVTVEFGDGFLSKNQICWACLQKAIKVRHRQQAKQDTSGQHSKSTTSNANRDAS